MLLNRNVCDSRRWVGVGGYSWNEKRRKKKLQNFHLRFLWLCCRISPASIPHISLSRCQFCQERQVNKSQLVVSAHASVTRVEDLSLSASDKVPFDMPEIQFFFSFFFCRLNSRLTPLSALCAVKTHLFYIHSPSVVSSKDRDLCAHVADSLHLRFLCCFFCCCSLSHERWAQSSRTLSSSLFKLL